MIIEKSKSIGAMIALACSSGIAVAAPAGTGFSFQGELIDGGAPVTGQCDFEFTLWDDAAAGSPVGSAVAQTIDVADGRFTTLLDFGAGIFTGDARWVEINVCCTSPCSPAFTTLSPRQELTPVPYALHAANASDGHSLDASDGDPADAVFVDADGKVGVATTAPDAQFHLAQGEIWVGGTFTTPVLPPSAGAGLRMFNSSSPGVSKIYAHDYATGAPRNLALQETGGKVGIGTTSPGERLTVNGTVQSTLGGFKFPDGTVQTTAAGGGNTLDSAYDEGGAGAGRTITADAGALEIQGPDGLVVAGTITSGSSIIIDGTSGAERISSTDAMEIHTSTGRIMRLEPESVSSDGFYENSPNIIGGWSGNSVTVGVIGATISGGGVENEFGGGSAPNRVTDDFGTVCGGFKNRAGNDAGTPSDARSATVAGGYDNTASQALSFVGGGQGNSANSFWSTVCGGSGNTAGGEHSTVGGGQGNVASGNRSTISGGLGNTASGVDSTIGGGQTNTAGDTSTTVAGGDSNSATAARATVSGGILNTASGTNAAVGGGIQNTASGSAAAIPGGQGNVAGGQYSFAAGRSASADHNGSFVWGDSSTSATVNSTAANQLTARTAGGARFFTNSALTSGVTLAAGGGSWSSISDKNVKREILPVDSQEVLDRLAVLPISTWNYKSQDPSIRHIGPMAQDFHAAFSVGEDERYIGGIDADGVALAAIQGLHSLVEEKDCRIEELEQHNTALEARFVEMERLLTALERRMNGGAE